MNLPLSFISELKNKIGNEDFDAYMDSFNTDPVVSVRFNPHKMTKPEGLSSVPWCRLGYYLNERPVFTLDPSFHSGAYYVQEASSMFLWHILDNISPDSRDLKILDLSAAPGGKSTLIATWLNNNGVLCANDPIKNRAYTLKYNLLKEGFTNIIVTNNDPKDYGELKGCYDIILVDAPCSGEGMFRKDLDAIGEWSPDHVQHCSLRQRRILTDVLPALKEGGYLIYSTCTFNATENMNNVGWLTDTFPLTSVNIPVNSNWGIITEEYKNAIGYQFYPHRVRGEGFFSSVLQKKRLLEKQPKLKSDKTKLSLTSRNVSDSLKPWIKMENQSLFSDRNNMIHVFSSAYEEWMYTISYYLKIIYCGTHAGTFNRNIFIPDHSLALSLFASPSITKFELSKNDALLYLKKELTQINTSETGWILSTYNGIGIGWLKNIGHRINNYLPSEYRIIMDLPKV